MGAETICEIYRTNEKNGTYCCAVTITYFNNTAFIQGLSGHITKSCYNELYAYLSDKHISDIFYIRHKQSGKQVKHINLGEYMAGGRRKKRTGGGKRK